MSMPASSRHGVVDEPWSENLSIALPRGLHAEGLEVGPSNACIWSGADLRCWGSGSHYLSGSSSQQSTPMLMNWPEGEPIESVSIGRTVACGLSISGDPRCWGYMGSNGLESGSHSTGSHSSPRTFSRTGLDLYDLDLKISMGNQFGCGLTFDGQLMCWGNNGFGQLGRGGTSSWELIGQVHGPSTWGKSSTWTLAVSHTCALSSAGELHCWGRNRMGRSASGTRPIRSSRSEHRTPRASTSKPSIRAMRIPAPSIRMPRFDVGATTHTVNSVTARRRHVSHRRASSSGTSHLCRSAWARIIPACSSMMDPSRVGVRIPTANSASPPQRPARRRRSLPISQWMWRWCRSARGPPPHAACQARVRSGAGAAMTSVNWVRVMPRIEMSPPA